MNSFNKPLNKGGLAMGLVIFLMFSIIGVAMWSMIWIGQRQSRVADQKLLKPSALVPLNRFVVIFHQDDCGDRMNGCGDWGGQWEVYRDTVTGTEIACYLIRNVPSCVVIKAVYPRHTQ